MICFCLKISNFTSCYCAGVNSRDRKYTPFSPEQLKHVFLSLLLDTTLKTHSIKPRSNHLILFIHHFARGSKAVSSLALDFLSIPFNIDFLLRTVFLCSWKNTLWAGSAEAAETQRKRLQLLQAGLQPLHFGTFQICYAAA